MPGWLAGGFGEETGIRGSGPWVMGVNYGPLRVKAFSNFHSAKNWILWWRIFLTSSSKSNKFNKRPLPSAFEFQVQKPPRTHLISINGAILR